MIQILASFSSSILDSIRPDDIGDYIQWDGDKKAFVLAEGLFEFSVLHERVYVKFATDKNATGCCIGFYKDKSSMEQLIVSYMEKRWGSTHHF